jgi:acetyl-CoA carboxylase biotin carboxylase subunit
VLVRKVLIANRGEIAVRIVRACRDLGLATVAVYSDCDRRALHVRLADEAWSIGGLAPGDSYLRIDALIDVAQRAGADAVHPGYGFLAENADFADACRDAGLGYVGPSGDVIRVMGSKTGARRAAMAVGVQVVPGTAAPLPAECPDAEVAAAARETGYPLMLKAVAGGGGRGMRVVAAEADLVGALRAARSEAQAAFGDASVYIERLLVQPRHIEVQLLGDEHGTVLPFVERECSIQRRHQKVLEESPSAAVTPELRVALTEAAARVARQVGYTNAGTIEFLLDRDGQFYFLEMNTRLQVEHPVTEMVTGVDLVQWQLRLAQGDRLSLDPAPLLAPRGHAIEARIYAEDPDNRFLPFPGHVTHLRAPSGPGIRDDSGLTAPGDVPIYYDALVSKLAAWGADRTQAVARLARALREYEIEGIRTTLPFFRWLLTQEDYVAARVDTTWLDRVLAERAGRPFWVVDGNATDLAAIAAGIQAYARSAARSSASSSPAPASQALSAWTWAARREALR